MNELLLIKHNDWAPLFKAYNPMLHRIMWDDKTRSVREDLAQEVWIKAYINREQYNGDGFKSWLGTIAWNMLRGHYREVWMMKRPSTSVRMKRSMLLDYSCYPTDELTWFSDRENYEESRVNEEEYEYMLKQFRDAVDMFPEKKKIHRQILLLMQKFNTNTITEMLNIKSAETTRRTAYWGIQEVKKILKVAVMLLLCFSLNAQSQVATDCCFNGDTVKWMPETYLYPAKKLFNKWTVTPGYSWAKCKIVIKNCSNCPQYLMNAYEKVVYKEGAPYELISSYDITYWTTPYSRIKFSNKLIFISRHSLNW